MTGSKKVLIFINLIIVSLFFFPFSLKGVPFFNTKMILALIGLVLLIWEAFRKKNVQISCDLFSVSIIAMLVSLVGLISITYNNTQDSAYVTYIVSMWVWMSASYLVYRLIKYVHVYPSVSLISDYLICVCIFQCVIAQVLDNNLWFNVLVDRYIEQGQGFCKEVNRIYGIGATLDVAGSRFSAVLVILTFLITHIEDTRKKKLLPYYLISFVLIAVLGNMIARTTSVGIVISVIYLVYKSGIHRMHIENGYKKMFFWLICLSLIFIPILSYYYNNDPEIKKTIRFAFEAYFNYVENGSLQTGSTNKLKTMYVYPENLKTWIIGDGYFSNPIYTDQYYNGPKIDGYYMGTDVGYLRFIFYFGSIGLLFFSALIIKVSNICATKFKDQKDLFYLLMLLNFIIWLKVSTDIFLVFALFFMIGKDENEEYNKSILIGNEDNLQYSSNV